MSAEVIGGEYFLQQKMQNINNILRKTDTIINY